MLRNKHTNECNKLQVFQFQPKFIIATIRKISLAVSKFFQFVSRLVKAPTSSIASSDRKQRKIC